MIAQIELDFFKCFQKLKLPLEALTVLSGANASGKSTVLQALVLLHQTMLEHEWSDRLQLNGSEIQLGNVADIVDKTHGRRSMKIGLVDTDLSIRWNFLYDENKQDMSFGISKIQLGYRTIDNPKSLRFLIPTKDRRTYRNLTGRLLRLNYITAERVGPRDSYQLQDPSATQVVGPCGENAVGLLHLKRDENVLPAIVIDSEPPTLLRQVEARMRQFFPRISLSVAQVPQTSIVTMGIRTSDTTDFHRPVNVGFGVTQVLPIVVAALSAKTDDLLLIENPEVHLHPAAQALMGRFLSEIASAGIQVMVETHSDHVLNGIRRSVKGKVLNPQRVAIHFFRSRDSQGDQVTTPRINELGNIDFWPEGFFDQFDKDVNYFAGWGE